MHEHKKDSTIMPLTSSDPGSGAHKHVRMCSKGTHRFLQQETSAMVSVNKDRNRSKVSSSNRNQNRKNVQQDTICADLPN